MARPLNASSYYRANPFYQQGYLPDAALRNRKEPTHYSEIPQGWQHFDPTNKKHYQKQGYYSNIAQDRIMSQQDDPAASRSRQKQYFRSLNVQDIEGATTNTLISQAIKNRMKAKEQLARRQQEQNQRDEIMRMQQAMKSHEDNMREKALEKLRSNSPINYHLAKNTQKQMPSPQKIQQPYKEENMKQIKKEHQSEMYRREILKTERQLLELQNKLNSSRAIQEQERGQYENMPHRSASDLNLLPITNQPIVNSTNYHTYRESNPEYEPTSIMKNPEAYRSPVPALNGPINRRSPYQQSNPQRQMRDYQLLTGKELQGPGGRSQHRRFNPTFLSYGSPTIGLAGKNIVGG